MEALKWDCGAAIAGLTPILPESEGGVGAGNARVSRDGERAMRCGLPGGAFIKWIPGNLICVSAEKGPAEFATSTGPGNPTSVGQADVPQTDVENPTMFKASPRLTSCPSAADGDFL